KAAVAACGQPRARDARQRGREPGMSTISTDAGTTICSTDWSPGRAPNGTIVFRHGWPLCADDWDAQMLFFVGQGYRVIAHDRRGHGRSSQTPHGNDMDTYAADAAALVDHLGVRDAIHVGHSTGGGEAARYAARYGKGKVAKLVLIGAVPPLLAKTPSHPGRVPIDPKRVAQ